jgi:hypothetical protein
VHQTSKANIPVYDAPNPISPPNLLLLNGYNALASIQKKPRFGGAFELGGIPQALD